MPKPAAIKGFLSKAINDRFETDVADYRTNHLDHASQGNPHSCMLVAIANSLGDSWAEAFLEPIALGVAWAPIDAAWSPVSKTAKAVKQSISTLVSVAKDNAGSTMNGKFTAHVSRKKGYAINADVTVTWMLVHEPKTNQVALLCIGKVTRKGRTSEAAIAVTAKVNQSGVPGWLSIRRLPYKGSEIDVQIEEEDDGWCFLTTACTEARGLPDDCHELQVLRCFRDGYVAGLDGGRALISEFYRIAPTILRRIAARPDAARVYDALYRNLVSRSVAQIEAGQFAAAFSTYRSAVEDLKRAYMN